MNKIGNLVSVSCVLIAGTFLSIGSARARQTSQTKTFPLPPSQTGIGPQFPDNTKLDPETPHRERMEEQAAKARNSERFKRIQSDTDKLLQLSTELKADVDKSTKNELSLDVIRKAAEVEKLAHDVKERMKG